MGAVALSKTLSEIDHLEICAGVSEECAEECEQHDDDHCQICADALEDCVESCRNMVA